MLSIEEFYSMLELHEWWYDEFDDDDIYSDGQASWRDIQTIAHGNEDFQTLLEEYQRHVYNGGKKPWLVR